jgi:hypothetical protein
MSKINSVGSSKPNTFKTALDPQPKPGARAIKQIAMDIKRGYQGDGPELIAAAKKNSRKKALQS